ncbi:GYF domain-containing protein [Bradyrhizobium sp.]|uniref:GYF domain-containing protein n=1 Tax=Bradyrhizobium sp. TaxID=376 RepID=UPI003C72D7A7
MAEGWYVFDGARPLGPLGLNELKGLLEAQNSSATLVWREGLNEWVKPADLPEFAPARPPPIPVLSENERGQNTADVIAATPSRFGNFIAMNWRGEFSLGTTYWLFGVLGNLFAGALAIAVVAGFRSAGGFQPKAIFAAILLVWVGIGALAIWQSVGIWRSANRHIKARVLLGKKSPWAGLAKVAVFIGALRLVATFLTSGWPQLLETGRMSFLDDPDIPAYSIRVMRNGTEAEIAGGFKYGLTDDFLRLLSASRQIRVVHLDSLGGRIGEALRLNRVISSRSLDTYVSSRCMSACTIAFAGGGRRILRNGAVLGFHAPSFPGWTEAELAEASKDQKDIFAVAGFDRKFVDQALSTPNTELWKPASSVLLQANVITAISDGSDFAMSGIGTSLTKSDLGTKLSKTIPLLEPLRARFPNEYDSVVQVYYDSFKSGKTEAESFAAGREEQLVILKKLRPLADDAVLSDISAVYADQYDALGSKSPAQCYQFASGIGNTVMPSDIPLALRTRENDINRRVVETAKARAAVSAAASDAILKKVRAAMASKGVKNEQFDLLSGASISSGKYSDYCKVATMFFREISKLPHAEAGMIMRDMFADR